MCLGKPKFGLDWLRGLESQLQTSLCVNCACIFVTNAAIYSKPAPDSGICSAQSLANAADRVLQAWMRGRTSLSRSSIGWKWSRDLPYNFTQWVRMSSACAVTAVCMWRECRFSVEYTSIILVFRTHGVAEQSLYLYIHYFLFIYTYVWFCAVLVDLFVKSINGRLAFWPICSCLFSL